MVLSSDFQLYVFYHVVIDLRVNITQHVLTSDFFLRWRCDGERDCDDGSDETSCDYQSDSVSGAGAGEKINCAEENSIRCGTQCVLR